MAGGFPNYIHYLEEEAEIYDQVLQMIDEQNGIIIEDEDEDEDEENSEYEEDNEEETEDEDEGFVPAVEAPRVSPVRPSASSQETVINQSSENAVEENGRNRTIREGGETSSSQQGGNGENASGEEWNGSDIDGLFCPICMEAWTNGGDHQVCCLPCGHLYGFSCIKKWLQLRTNSGKCPQCNRKCALKDIRIIYAPQIVVVDQEIKKKVRSLEAKCASLEKKDSDWHKKEGEWRKREVDLCLQVRQLTERTSYLQRLLGDTQSRPSRLFSASWGSQEQAVFGPNFDLELSGQGSSSTFILQEELQVDGARLFDVDASSQIFIIARRLSGMGGMHVLTKMSLIAPHERENIQLPVTSKAVRDLRVSPHGRLVLMASLGKKLSVISMESNIIVLSYDLPAAAWSCSWDLNSSHYAYTGLQNGMLLVFDMRQTLRPVESMIGLTSNPIHTVYSFSPDLTLPLGVRSLLTASSIGLCQWKFGGVEERPFLVPEADNQGVCIALAYSPCSNDIVASFRPKVEMSSDVAVSQPSLTPGTSLMGKTVQGSHVLYKCVADRCYQELGSTSANVDGIRLLRSAIIDRQNDSLLFASGDEATGELVLQEFPSFVVVQRLKSHKNPIHDVKYTHDLSSGLLTCLNEDILQLFSATLL